MTSNIESYVSSTSAEDVRSTALTMILLEVNSGKMTIHKLVESLGDYLQNRDSLVRARGTLLLSEVLCRLPDLNLNNIQIQFLCEFYNDRLQDYACSSEVVKGIFGIVVNHSSKIPYPFNQKILRSLFQEVHPTSLSQAHRKMVLQIIDHMLTYALAEVQELKGDFMVGYLQWIDGEKDPRNIMFSFNLVPKIVESIPEYKNFADSLFEILSCYFPISFNPKQGDPNSITRDDLVNALLKCFAITPLFAEHCVPFLIEKICSNVVDTKVESLKTLVHCCTKYGPLPLRPFLDEIWSTLRSQILTNKSSQVIEESKKTIYQICKILSVEKTILEQFLSMINKECLGYIKSSQDSKLAVSCASILFQTISSSVLASRFVLAFIIPNLLTFFDELTLQIANDPIHKANEQLSVIGLFNDLLKANILSFQTLNQNTDINELNPIEPFKIKLFDLFFNLLSNQSVLVRALAVECLSNLYISKYNKQEYLLDQEKRQIVLKSLISYLNDQDDGLRTKSLECLLLVSKDEDIKVLNVFAIPTLLHMINSTTLNTDSSLKETKHYLLAFSSLCTHHHILKSVMNQIQSLLNHNIKLKYNSNDEYQKSISVLESIVNIFTKSLNESIISDCYESVLFALMNELFSIILSIPGENTQLDPNIEKIFTFGLIMIESIIRNISLENQKQLIYKVINIYLNGDLSIFKNESFQNIKFKPFELVNNNQNQLIPIFSTIISQFKFDITTITEASSIQQILFQHSIKQGESESISYTCAKCLASVLNKKIDQSQITMDFINTNLLSLIQNTTTDSSIKMKALNTLIWITKALITNGNSLGIQLGKKLAELIASDNQQVSTMSSQSFELLLNEENDKGLLPKVLYQQKFFTLLFPVLLESFKSYQKNPESINISSQYLIAITNLLKNIPKEVLLGELDEVLPIVLHSLQSKQIGLLGSSLETLHMLFVETPTSIQPHLAILIPELINISIHTPQFQLRKSALSILTIISRSLPYQSLLPYQQTVLTGLIPSLDDKKRLVRKESTTCRNSWFILKQ